MPHARRRHHVVSMGYMRPFSDGTRTLLCNKASRTAKLAGLRSVFVYARFNSVRTQAGWVDDLEDHWARIEASVLPAVRAIISGEKGGDRNSVKALAALHTARSYGYREMFTRIADSYALEAPGKIASSLEVLAAFRESIGRDPNPGEIEEYIANRFQELKDDNSMLVERMANTYNRSLDYYRDLYVQLLHPASKRHRFLTGDTPVVHFSKLALQVGFRDGLALFEADHLYMPLAPTVAMMLTTTDEGDEPVNPLAAIKLNVLVYRASRQFLACHPADDPSRLLGMRFAGPPGDDAGSV